MKLEINAVDEILQKIINEKVGALGRAGAMLWLNFGEVIDAVNYKGQSVKKSEYAIHIQCSWRIKNKQSRNIIAFYDMFEPNSSTEWSEDFDWDVQGNNLYDEKAKKWSTEHDRYIVDYKISPNLDLIIMFSDGNILEAFIDTSSKKECWRLFERKKDNHVVASGIDLYIGDDKVFEIETNVFSEKKQILDWGNPKSEVTYGTTFVDHGSHHKEQYLKEKARVKSIHVGQYGQWTDDQKAAEFIAKIAEEKGSGTYDVSLPPPIPPKVIGRDLPEYFPCRVISAGGLECRADMARVVVNSDGSVEIAYPFNSRYPH